MIIKANDGSTYEYELTGTDETTVSFGPVAEPKLTTKCKTREEAMLTAMYQAYVDAYQGSDSQVSDDVESLFQTMISLAEKFPFPA